MISEKIELLGKGVYEDIPDVLTLTAIPTLSELDYVGAEDFDDTMITKILPKAVEEKINFNNLLQIDYQWVCRCLRLLNFGPYHTTNSIFCDKCGKTHYGEYQVDLRSIECKPLPDGFKNDVMIGRDEFINFDQDVRFKLPTIREIMTAYNDKAFATKDGRINRELARMCYMIKSIGNEPATAPIETKLKIAKEFSAADYMILKGMIAELTDYGLRAGGTVTCPKCGNPGAAYIALMDDRFFRCSLDNLRKWRDDNRSRKGKDIPGSKKTDV